MNQTNPNQDGQALAEPPRRSPWSKKARLARLLWGVCELVLWKPSPAGAWGFRRQLLRVFGARIGNGVRIHPTVKVIIPWHLDIGGGVTVHQRAILYALGMITIGEDSEIGPLVHLCAGTHDYTDPAFTLLRQPITIGRSCVLQAASFVAPNVVLADRTVLMPRCALHTNSAPDTCYVGNPGRPYSPLPARSGNEWEYK